MNWTHGTHGLLIGFGVAAGCQLFGLAMSRAKPIAYLVFLITAPVGFLVTVALWSVLSGLIEHKVPASLLPYIGIAFIGVFNALLGRILAGSKDITISHKRGALVGDLKEGLAAAFRTPSGLTLAGLKVPEADETKHFKMIGTTGTGKSTAIRELLGGALDRGDRAVIADPDGSYLRYFYDVRRGDQILNPFDPRATRWDLFGEISQLHDADQLSRSLIADTEGAEASWRNYARVFLTSLLRQLHRVKHHDVGELYTLIATTPVDDLRELLADTPAGPYLSQDNGRFFAAVRAVANTHLSALEHVAGQKSEKSLSVRSWVRNSGKGGGSHGQGGGVLFLPYNANEIAILRSVISTWMRLAIFETMARGEAADQKLWFVVDELDALGQIDGLKDALARLRKFGGRCVLGFQSIAQVSGTYGRAEAQTIVENCGNTLILRCSTSEGGGTARFASALIGEREVLRNQITKSRRPTEFLPTTSTAEQHVTESAVLPSEIEQLPDLHGILKLASQPEWKRVKLSVGATE